MNSKRYLLAGLVLALISLACSVSFGTPATPTPVPPTATFTPTQPPPTPVPTPTPPPTPTSAPPTSAPTSRPQPTAPPPPPPTITLSNTLYTHPNNLFHLHPPKGWHLNNEGEAFANFVPVRDDQVSMLVVTAINTGTTLDDASFKRLVDSYEQGYETKERYQLLERTFIDGAAKVIKAYTCDGKDCISTTGYYQDGPTVIIIDLIQPKAKAKTANAYFKALTNDLRYDTDSITARPLYDDYWTYTAPNNLFTMQAPMAWYYTYQEDKDTVLEEFRSPDNQAYIESIVYDDGTTYSKTEAGKITLNILREVYAQDLKITDDQVQPDGSERLTWHSKAQGTTGVTFFETRGTSFLLLSMVASNDTFDMYLDLFNNILASYDIP